MTEQQRVHVAMINSFNVLTKRTTVGRVVYSDIPLIAHDLHLGVDEKALSFMISYFESIEMFEKCEELKKIYQSTFDDEGALIQDLCECEYPDPKKYSKKTKCETCKKPISN